MAIYKQGIVIDGIFFDIPFVEINRSAEIKRKYQKMTQDGVIRSEIIGTYFNFDAAFGFINDTSTYEKLYNKLAEPVDSHEIILKLGNVSHTYTVSIDSISDKISKMLKNETKMEALRCTFKAKTPTLTGGVV